MRKIRLPKREEIFSCRRIGEIVGVGAHIVSKACSRLQIEGVNRIGSRWILTREAAEKVIEIITAPKASQRSLTAKDIRQIRRMRQKGKSIIEIAEAKDRDKSLISRVLNGKAYRDVK